MQVCLFTHLKFPRMCLFSLFFPTQIALGGSFLQWYTLCETNPGDMIWQQGAVSAEKDYFGTSILNLGSHAWNLFVSLERIQLWPEHYLLHLGKSLCKPCSLFALFWTRLQIWEQDSAQICGEGRRSVFLFLQSFICGHWYSSWRWCGGGFPWNRQSYDSKFP